MMTVIIFLAHFLSIGAQARQMSVETNPIANMSNIVYSGNNHSRVDKGVEINLFATCYSRNLRGVSNPIGRNTTVDMILGFPKSSQKEYSSIKIRFPSSIVVKNARSVLKTFSVFGASGNPISSVKATAAGNALRVHLPGMNVGTISVDPYGNVKKESTNGLLSSIKFNQTGGLNGRYLSKDGPLSADVRRKVSNNGKRIEVYANFPGENGFCGGYYSPLALFFEKGFKSVSFKNHSFFPLNKDSESFYWPSPKDEVYFLALDINEDGKINNSKELFGETPQHKNGFLSLKVHDKNKDGVIDQKDRIFKELKLWKDINGNGITEKGELKGLSSKSVTSISLRYNSSEENSYGNRAKAKERSFFTYRGRDRKIKKGEIIDIWLAPSGHTRRGLSSER